MNETELNVFVKELIININVDRELEDTDRLAVLKKIKLEHCSPQVLIVAGVALTSEMFEIIVDILEADSLISIDLSACELNDQNLIRLCSSLINNKNLLRLDVSSNLFSIDGVLALTSVIKENKFLLQLVLFGNKGISYGSSHLLLTALEKNYTLLSMNVDETTAHEEFVYEIKDLLSRNANLFSTEIKKNPEKVLNYAVSSVLSEIRDVSSLILKGGIERFLNRYPLQCINQMQLAYKKNDKENQNLSDFSSKLPPTSRPITHSFGIKTANSTYNDTSNLSDSQIAVNKENKGFLCK